MDHRFEHKRDSLVCHSLLDGAALTRIIAEDYDLAPPVRCSLFRSRFNDVYEVASRDERHMLRIARAERHGHFDEAAYRFELDLLGFLGARGSPISRPLLRRNGEPLGAIVAPEGKRYYALFTWADGAIPTSLEPAQGYMLGQTLAHLHLAMNDFSSPHRRFHLDEDYLIHEPIRRLRTFAPSYRDEIAYLDTLAPALCRPIREIRLQPDTYGIIHGDFWLANLHLAGDRVTLFDFDFCGYGWRALDIASVRANVLLHDDPLFDAGIDSFLAGYQAVRPLAQPELAAISAFEKITLLWAFGVWAAYVDVFGTDWFQTRFPQALATLQRSIESER